MEELVSASTLKICAANPPAKVKTASTVPSKFVYGAEIWSFFYVFGVKLSAKNPLFKKEALMACPKIIFEKSIFLPIISLPKLPN